MSKQIYKTSGVFETSWFSLVEKHVVGEEAPYYSLQMLDYVGIFAISEQGRILLVRQYRPAVESVTLELPSGHVEKGESPADAARRELLEETGYRANEVFMVGDLIPDSGRLSNRQWCYFAPDAVRTADPIEDGIELVEMEPAEFLRAIKRGEFVHSLHLAIMVLTMLRGHWQPPGESHVTSS